MSTRTIGVTTTTVSITGSLPMGLRYTGDNRFRQDDQASRLRAMVTALQETPVPAPAGVPPTTPPLASAPESRGGGAHGATPAAAPMRTCPVVAITSGKGGVGKTSTCVNLAIALSQRGVKATVVDADLGLANADLICGMTPTTRLDSAVDLVRDDLGRLRKTIRPLRSLSQIAVDAPGGFRLVPGSVGVMRMANLSPAQRDVILAGLLELERESDIVLVDTGAGLSDGVTSFVAASDLAVVVATPEPTSIADAYAMIKCVAQVRQQQGTSNRLRMALVINQAGSPAEGQAVHARINATCKRFLSMDVPLLGVLHEDLALPASVRARRPVLLSNPTARVCRDIRLLSAQVAAAVNVPLRPAIEKRRGRMFGWFLGQ
mgnify:CR=1 FL=1